MTHLLASIGRLSTLSVAQLVPVVAHPESPAHVVGVDTEHIFGFTEGTDIGDKSEIELESTFVGRFGKRGSFAALQNETAIRYGISDSFCLALGTLFDYRSIYNVPDLDDYSGFARLGAAQPDFRATMLGELVLPLALPGARPFTSRPISVASRP